MKKIMMMAAAVMVSLAANAQTSPEAKAIKKLKTLTEVQEAYKAAEAAMSADDKAFVLNKISELAAKEATSATEAAVKAQLAKDEAGQKAASDKEAVMAYTALAAADECFKLNSKAVKVADKLMSLRALLVNAGLNAYNSKNYADAEKYFAMYVDAKENPLFSKADFTKETGLDQVAYYAGLASYFNKDNKSASRFADTALTSADAQVIADALTLKIGVLDELAKAAQIDTASYVSEVKKLYANHADNDAVLSKLYTLYDEMGKKADADAVLDTRLAQNPADVMANALKGQAAQNEARYDDAIAFYGKVLEAKPDFIVAKLNQGVCYLTKAAAVIDANTDARGNIRADKKEGVIADLQKAKKVLEECKAEDPTREQANWSYPLERVNYILDNIN